MHTLRWGVLGVSKHFTMRVFPPLKCSLTVRFRAIASRDADRAKQTADSLGIPAAHGSYEALVADDSIDAVYIPLPNNLHLEWIKKAADAGKHVLCEKPLTMNAREAEEAVEYADSKGVLLMEAFMYRFHPQWRHAAELAQTGNIGSLRGMQTFFSYNNTDPANIRNRPETGGGGIYDIGCYAVSTARFIFGREPSRVICLAERDPDFGVDRLASAILDFDGVHAVFTVGTQTTPFQRVDITGSSGRIHIHVPFNTPNDVPAGMTVVTSVGERLVQFEPVDQYRLQFEGFSAAVHSDCGTPIPPSDALGNMRVLDALFRSAESGEWETV